MTDVDYSPRAITKRLGQTEQLRRLSLSLMKAKQAHDVKLAAGDLWRDGHVTLRRVANEAEISIYRRAISEAVERLTTENLDLDERDT